MPRVQIEAVQREFHGRRTSQAQSCPLSLRERQGEGDLPDTALTLPFPKGEATLQFQDRLHQLARALAHHVAGRQAQAPLDAIALGRHVGVVGKTAAR